MSKASPSPRPPASSSYRRKGADVFRRWLAERLSVTWAHLVKPDGSMPGGLPEALGVTPAVLVEARAIFDERRRQAGVPAPAGRKRAGTGHRQLQLWFPKEVWDVWLDWCEVRGMKGSVAIRSLVQHYLLGPEEPQKVNATWVWQGRLLPVRHKPFQRLHRGRWPYKEDSLVSTGAYQALAARARRRGCSTLSLLRGLVLEALEGRIRDVPIVDARTMYDDPERYWQPTPAANE